MYSPEQDSSFAKALLLKSSESRKVIDALIQVTPRLSGAVLAPIIEKLKLSTPLSVEETGVIEFLAGEHSKEGLQWGGALSHLSKTDILKDNESKLLLLTTLSEKLDPKYIHTIDKPEALAGVMKAITDCSFCYVEKLKDKHSAKFELIKNNIFPTPEELSIRVMRKEIGQEEQVAITYGIGTKPGVDIAPKDPLPTGTERVHSAGKAAFSGANTLERVKLVTKTYDETKKKLKDLNTQLETLTQSQDNTELITQRDKCIRDLDELTKKMTFYKIPLELKERAPDPSYHRPPKPSIEKLSEFGGEGKPLPMIATASGTTARTLIALQDLGAFSQTGEFDPKLAQIVSSALCGTIVHGGHHSVLEVGEMYNRLLDYNVISQMEEHGKQFSEEKLPYYRIGDSFTLVPEEMRRDVSDEQQKILSIESCKDFREKVSGIKGADTVVEENTSTQSKNIGQL